MKKEDIQKQIIEVIEEVKKTTPLVPSITNTVTVNLVANTQIAVGGSAAMIYLPDEAEALATVGKAMYINMGTFLPIYEQTLPRVTKLLHEFGKNWVIDPVGLGVGGLRNKTLYEMKNYRPPIISGNSSEIMALAGLWGLDGGEGENEVRGVDSKHSVSDAKRAAISLARYTKGAVGISGEVDFITDGKVGINSFGGSHYFGKITGAGCSLAGVMAVYASYGSPLIGALAATNIYNFAGAKAEKFSNGPGSFEVNFIDELYNATSKDVAMVEFTLEEI